jgi:PAS domain S-box-containing protein
VRSGEPEPHPLEHPPRTRSDAGIDDAVVWSIVDAAPDALVVTDEAGRILLVNRQTEAQFGYDRADLLGRSVDTLLPEELRSTHAAHRDRYRASPGLRPMGSGMRLRGRRADGSEFAVEVGLSPISTDDGLRIVAAIRDIGERLDAEARHLVVERELRVIEERDRMARDLHDLVIQRLFATGMAAQSLTARVTDPAISSRLDEIVDELDETIREIRRVIFALDAPTVATESLGHRILSVIDEQRPALGIAPRLHIEGPVDSTPDDVAEQLLAILREALSNVARHARATDVTIRVEADEILTLRVADNGVGMPAEPGSGKGLRNMAERARSLGGDLTATASAAQGTTIECSIPLATVDPPRRGPD